MEPLRCIILDDEEGAHLVLGHFMKDMNSLLLCKSFYNAIEAMEYMYHHRVDLIFLDINMPGLTGLELLAALSNPPLVILTTAYTEYALEGYKYQVVDYLVKPIEFPRFVAAVDKVISRHKLAFPVMERIAQSVSPGDFLMLKVEGDIVKVPFASISYLQSWGNYVKVYTEGGVHISPTTTSEIEQKLDAHRFMRIHKSYIVALSRIQRISGAQAHLDNGAILPIGNTFRRELLQRMQ